MTLASLWSDYIPRADLERILRTPFLQACAEGSVTRSEMERFLVQHFHYSRHFTRFLCAVIANLDCNGDRRELSENLFEEMGLGDFGNETHAAIYRRTLQNLNLDPEEEEPLPETLSLVETMFDLCRTKDPIVGLGALCLGAEAIVPELYSVVVTGMQALAFAADDLIYFTMHIEDDEAHAMTMMRLIRNKVEGDPLARARLRQSASTILDARRAFFEALTTSAESTVGSADESALQESPQDIHLGSGVRVANGGLDAVQL